MPLEQRQRLPSHIWHKAGAALTSLCRSGIVSADWRTGTQATAYVAWFVYYANAREPEVMQLCDCIIWR